MTEKKNINEQNEELTTDEMAVESENVEVSDTENAENTESNENEDAEKTETEKLEEQITDLKDK